MLALVAATMGFQHARDDFPAVLRRAAELAGVDLAATHPAARSRPRKTATEALAEARREATALRAEVAYLRELLTESEAARITERTILLAVARDALDGIGNEGVAQGMMGFGLAARLATWPGSVEDAASGRTGDPTLVWG